MSDKEIRRLRRRKKKLRSIKRGVTSIILAPGKIPRIAGDFLAGCMRACEIASLLFAIILIAHIAAPSTVGVGAVVVTGVIFAALLGTIVLSDYQDKLDEYELFGFKV